MNKASSELNNQQKVIDKYLEKIKINKLSYDEKKSKLIPLLEKIQQTLGNVSHSCAIKVADALNLPLSHIYGVLTFYNSFKLEQSSKYVLSVCRGTACHVNGSEELLNKLKEIIKKSANPEFFTIETVNCVGACSLAPVIVVNGKIHGKMNEAKIKKLVNTLSNSCKK